MNKSEYYKRTHKCYKYYKQVQKLLKDWKTDNNYTCKCVVHHRDDTEECRKYNEEHYEFWGFEIDKNGNPKFELGKYVQFMTHSEHSSHHNAGENHPLYGKHHTEEACVKMSESNAHYWKGKHLSMETREKLSAAHTGKCFSTETRAKMSASHTGKNSPFYGKSHTDEVKETLSATGKARIMSIKFLHEMYKNNGGKKKLNEFQKALKNGDITFEMQPITVFANGGTR